MCGLGDNGRNNQEFYDFQLNLSWCEQVLILSASLTQQPLHIPLLTRLHQRRVKDAVSAAERLFPHDWNEDAGFISNWRNRLFFINPSNAVPEMVCMARADRDH